MSLKGNATTLSKLRGRINACDILLLSAYGIAVKNGFKGTEEEWLAYLSQKAADDVMDRLQRRIADVVLYANQWQGSTNPYSQVVQIEGVTENSQVDLTPSVEQLVIFHDKDLAFVTENEDGVVTVYAIGQKPENDYTIQVTITEVRE